MCARKLLAFKANLAQSCSGKLSKARSCSPKLFPRVVVQSYCPKSCDSSNLYNTPEWHPKVTPQSYCLLKALCKATPKLFRKACQSCFVKRFPEAASQSCSPKYLCKVVAPKRPYASNLLPKVFPKTILQSNSRKLLPKIAAKSCSPKLRFKAIPQKCSLFHAIVQSCSGSPKLLPKFAPQMFPKAVPQNLLSKAAPNSC